MMNTETLMEAVTCSAARIAASNFRTRSVRSLPKRSSLANRSINTVPPGGPNKESEMRTTDAAERMILTEAIAILRAIDMPIASEAVTEALRIDSEDREAQYTIDSM
jgi:hypothetical protein